MAYTITYQIDNKMYINLTNKCNNDCTFCIRNTSEGVSGYHLWLDKEPTVQEVITNLEKGQNFSEVVFCGFGEPTYRYDAIVEIAKYSKEKGYKTRINTNGQSDLIRYCSIDCTLY